MRESGPPKCSAASASGTGSTISPPSFPAASSSASPSPGRWRPAPKLLFADEPTGNLDARNGEQIVDLLFNLHRTLGTTLILVTHDHKLAERCRRIVRIEDGQIAGVARKLEGVA
jgi:hypothetical protein